MIKKINFIYLGAKCEFKDKFKKYTIQTIVICERNLENKYSQRLTDLLRTESAIQIQSFE